MTVDEAVRPHHPTVSHTRYGRDMGRHPSRSRGSTPGPPGACQIVGIPGNKNHHTILIMLETIQKQWTDAQSLPMKQRIKTEEKLMNALAQQSAFCGLDGNSLQLLCQRGNPSGWAFVHGFSVHWFPSRGIAKHAYSQDRKVIRANDGRGREALGPAPTPCTLLDAIRWGRGSCQAFF